MAERITQTSHTTVSTPGHTNEDPAKPITQTSHTTLSTPGHTNEDPAKPITQTSHTTASTPGRMNEDLAERIAQTSHATVSAPGHVNEDLAASGPGWVLVLDGATPVPGVVSGCVHGVPWLVRGLAAAMAGRLTAAGPGSLAQVVDGAIGEVRDAHAGTCDLANPDSPSSTLAAIRIRGAWLEYLVLCDSPILLAHRDGRLTLLADDRLARLPGRRPYSRKLVRASRNQPGGFWVASTDPAAAYRAVQGTIGLDSVTDVVLCTDGVTRLADWYGYRWPDILARLRDAGPADLLSLVRAAERAYPHPRQKQHDDATVAHMRW